MLFNKNVVANGLVAELAPPHVQNVGGLGGERVRAAELAACCNYFSKKKKKKGSVVDQPIEWMSQSWCNGKGGSK